MSSMKPIPLEEFMRILPTFSRRYQALSIIGVTTGARISEILALQRIDIADADGVVRERVLMPRSKLLCGVPKAKQSEKSGLPVRRECFIFNDLMRDAIARYLDELADCGFERPSDYLFSFGAGRKLTRLGAYFYFRRRLGVGFGTHWMRKTYAMTIYNDCIAQGRDMMTAVKTVQHHLWHKSVDTTIRYLGLYEEAKDDQCKRCFSNLRWRSDKSLQGDCRCDPHE